MDIYYCHHCDRYVDDNYEPGEVDPDDDCELICPSCWERHEESLEELKQINRELEAMRVKSMKRGPLNLLIGD